MTYNNTCEHYKSYKLCFVCQQTIIILYMYLYKGWHPVSVLFKLFIYLIFNKNNVTFYFFKYNLN